MRVPFILAGALLVARAAPAFAQTPPPITPPATGAEKVTCIQGGVPRTCTTGQIADLGASALLTTPNIWTAAQTFTNSTIGGNVSFGGGGVLQLGGAGPRDGGNGSYLAQDGHPNWTAIQSTKPFNPTEFNIYANGTGGEAVSTGTTTVTRSTGAAWVAQMVGHFFWFDGIAYTVSTFNNANSLTLSAAPPAGTKIWSYSLTTGSGTASITGTTLSRLHGDPFISQAFGAGFQLLLNGVPIGVTYINPDTYTLASAPGDTSSAAYSYSTNINNQITTLRIQLTTGQDEENLSAYSTPFGYRIGAQQSGIGRLKSLYLSSEYQDVMELAAYGKFVSLGGPQTLEAMRVGWVASAVNRFDVTGGTVGSAPQIAAGGTDTNIDMALTPKGTGGVTIKNGGLDLPMVSGASVANPASGYKRFYVDSTTGLAVYKSSTGAIVGSYNCHNLLDFGGDRTGAVDNSSAVALVASIFGAKNICLYMPAGTYLFNTAISLQAGTSSDVAASLMVVGDGADLTRVKMASAINGLNIFLNDCTQSFHLRDFSILAGNKSTTTVGINVAQSGTCGSNPAQNDISGVTVRGNDGYNSAFRFGIGISIFGASNVNFQNVAVIGSTDGAAYGSAGTCLQIAGSSILLPVQFNLVASQFNDCGIGILYGTYAQGIQISASNFVGNGTAISQPSANVGNDQLAISASQFNSGTRNIFLQAPIDGVTLAGNTFYTSGTATASVDIPGVQYAIMGNAFIQFSGTPSTGISIGTYSLDAGTITGNTFSGFNTAVFLQSGSQLANVQSNAYVNTATNVNNSGTSNTVGGGTP